MNINTNNKMYQKKFNNNNNGWNNRTSSQNVYSILEINSNKNTSEGVVLEDKLLPNHWSLWTHELYDTDWSIDSYKMLCSIHKISDFWRLYNNLNKMKIKYMHYFLMRGDIKPIWEDEKNRDGGICSLKVEIENSLELFEYLSVRIVLNKLTDDPMDINGISISPKNNWILIKIWNGNSSNDLSVILQDNVLDKYKKYSIKYRPNKPEY